MVAHLGKAGTKKVGRQYKCLSPGAFNCLKTCSACTCLDHSCSETLHGRDVGICGLVKF